VSAGELVIGNSRDPRNAVFKILQRSRNGWLTCQLVGEQDGRRIPDGFVCKFRTGDMVPFTGGDK
jgi:hypothetical protein